MAAWLVLLVACSGDRGDDAAEPDVAAEAGGERAPIVAVGPRQEVAPVPEWESPAVEVDDSDVEAMKARAAEALEAGDLFGDADDAIPLYLALSRHLPDDPDVATGLERARGALIEQGNAALAAIDEDREALGHARQVGAVSRELAPTDPAVETYLATVEQPEGNMGTNEPGRARDEDRHVGADAIRPVKLSRSWTDMVDI